MDFALNTKPPRDAATLLLLRDLADNSSVGAGFEVLMVRRQRGAAFMADAYVFPGGRVDPEDGGDFALAAAREAFEEAGVLLARDEQGSWATTDVDWIEPGRHAVRSGQIRFAELLAGHGLRVDMGAAIYFARWITPPTEPRRFDARFFLARTPPGQSARPDTAGEVVEFLWDTPHGVLSRHARGEIKLPPPTLWHLSDLAKLATVEDALAWARTRTIIPVRPKLWHADGVPVIFLPWDPDYDAVPVPEGEALHIGSPVAGAVTRYVLENDLWIARTVTKSSAAT